MTKGAVTNEGVMSPMRYVSVRCFVQDGGLWKAVATVERAGADDKTPICRTEFSSAQRSAGEALAEALQLAGFSDEPVPA